MLALEYSAIPNGSITCGVSHSSEHLQLPSIAIRALTPHTPGRNLRKSPTNRSIARVTDKECPMSRFSRPSSFVALGATIALALSVACDGGSTAAPGPVTTPSDPVPFDQLAPRVSSISPATGRTNGSTRVLISGMGFKPGATVTLDGAATDVQVVSSETILASTPPHAVGTVDVVVTNLNGRPGTLSRGYTYVESPGGVRPVITSIVPDHGIASGGTYVRISGAGLHAGTHLMLDGVPIKASIHDNTIYFQTSAHAPGRVDIEVSNPDGESVTLTGGFAFVAPESLKLDGQWQGNSGDHWEYTIRFTIENGAVTHASCNGQEHVFSPPASTATGEFSARVGNAVILSGKFFSSEYGVGTGAGPCGPWEIWKVSASGHRPTS
jgi:hypothetical protein